MGSQAGGPAVIWVREFLRLFLPRKGTGQGHLIGNFAGHHSLPPFSRVSLQIKTILVHLYHQKMNNKHIHVPNDTLLLPPF